MSERKELVSPRYVTRRYDRRVARDRSDFRWSQLGAKEQWRERLRWARLTHGSYATMESFAKAVGETGPNYRKYERLPSEGGNFVREHIAFDKAALWADELDVRREWLYGGEGSPWKDETPSFSAEARDVAERLDRLSEEERRVKAAAIKVLLTGTDG